MSEIERSKSNRYSNVDLRIESRCSPDEAVASGGEPDDQRRDQDEQDGHDRDAPAAGEIVQRSDEERTGRRQQVPDRLRHSRQRGGVRRVR